MEKEAETLYRKRGKRYKPHLIEWGSDTDTMQVGTFRLTHAYAGGGRRYEYEVTPDTASLRAAMMLAKSAMVRAIVESAPARPTSAMDRQYTAEELALINEFRANAAAIGMMLPDWWAYTTPEAIAQAAIDALG